MIKFLSGLISAIGVFLMFGAVGGIEYETMPLVIGMILSICGLGMIAIGLWMLDAVCGISIFGDDK